MPWTFDLPDGTGRGVFTSRVEALQARERDPEFRREVRGAKLRFFGLGVGQSLGDIPEHYSLAYGEPVRSRRHLKQLQKAHGTSDWEPSAKSRENCENDLQYRKDLARHSR